MRKVIYIIIASIIFVNCGGKGDSPAPVVKTKPKGKVQLQEPLENQVCLDVNVNYRWETVINADVYILKVFNENGSLFKEFTSTELSKTLQMPKGQSFSWKVIAKNESGEIESSTRSFITEGEAEVNFVPTAAVVIDKTNKELRINFNDYDKDELTYTVYYSLDNVFTDGEVLKNHNSKAVSSGKSVTIKKIDFTTNFWIKVIVSDVKKNKSTTVVSST